MPATTTETLGEPGSCHCGSSTCTGRCPECNMHETQTYGHNVHYDPPDTQAIDEGAGYDHTR